MSRGRRGPQGSLSPGSTKDSPKSEPCFWEHCMNASGAAAGALGCSVPGATLGVSLWGTCWCISLCGTCWSLCQLLPTACWSSFWMSALLCSMPAVLQVLCDQQEMSSSTLFSLWIKMLKMSAQRWPTKNASRRQLLFSLCMVDHKASEPDSWAHFATHIILPFSILWKVSSGDAMGDCWKSCYVCVSNAACSHVICSLLLQSVFRLIKC